MFGSESDSELVRWFMKLFAKLKCRIDDDPKHLLSDFDADNGLNQLVRTLDEAVQELKMLELGDQQLFSGPTNPQFITTWRDYENRFEPAVARLLSIFREGPVLDVPMKETADDRWERVNSVANELVDEISDQITGALRELDVPDSSQIKNNTKYGIDYLLDIHKELGFSMREAYRRRLLIPFTLIPRHVSKKYGNADRL